MEAQSDYHVRTYGVASTTPGHGVRYVTVAPELHHRTTTRHRATQLTSQLAQPDPQPVSPVAMSEQTALPNEVAQISEPVLVETTTRECFVFLLFRIRIESSVYEI